MKPLFHLSASALYLAAVFFSVGAAHGAPPAFVLVGGQLIDGYGGAPMKDSAIVVVTDKIVEVGREDAVNIPNDAQVIDVNGMTVLPGLWESHGHLMHIGEGDPSSFPRTFAPQAMSIMASVAKVSLLAGITSFRDTGGPIEPQLALKADIEAGRLPGPRLFLAGPILSQSKVDREGGSRYAIQSAQDARRVTEQVIGLGVDQVKVYGFWDLDVLTQLVKTAHAAGLGVDADVRHVHAYNIAIKAGVDRLSHVFTADALSEYSDEELRLLVRGRGLSATGPMANILRGPFIIPTIEMRNAYARVFRFPEMLDHPGLRTQFPEDVYQHLKSTWKDPTSIPWGIGAAQRVEVAKRKLANFIAAGGREQIVAGTDAGSPFNLHSPLTKEMEHYVEAGLTPMEVIQSATLRAAQLQGVDNVLGTVTAGKYADIIVVDGDPLQDITVLQHKVVLIVKDGQLFYPQRRDGA